jgi:hypothetical protein
VQDIEIRLIFLCQRNRVRRGRLRSRREIGSEENALHLRGALGIDFHMRPDGQHRAGRAAENIFGDGAEQDFSEALAPVRAHYGEVDVLLADDIRQDLPHAPFTDS